MNASQLACVGLLLQWAMHPCLADTVQQVETTSVHVSVDRDGVILLTNVPPVEEEFAPAIGPTVDHGKAQSRPFVADGAPRHAARAQAPPRSEPQADSGPEETVADEISSQLRDGGPPPEDH